MKKTMIEINGVSKKYRLGEINSTTLQHEIQSWWAKKRKKTDPNSVIGNPESIEEIYAVNDMSLKITEGETVGIIGRNGAGKSTLLKLLSRVTAPTSGTIDLYGRITSMLEVGTGFNGELTGRENIYINGAILGMTKAEVDRKINDIIDFSSLEQYIDTPVKRYSSGMYTKLGFAVAVNLESEIIIMDEVLAVGDVKFQNRCLNEMKKASKTEGRTVLYVSHNMNQIRKLCDRVIVLDEGRILFDGDCEKAIEYYVASSLDEDVYRDYRKVKRPEWLTDDRMRLVSAENLSDGGITVSDGQRLKLKLKFESREFIKNVGLRIEVQSRAEMKLGTYVFSSITDLNKGEMTEAVFSLDVGEFRENTYMTVYTFYESLGNGNYLNLDRVEGLSFTRLNSDHEEKLNWDFSNWGHLELNGGELESIRKEPFNAE